MAAAEAHSAWIIAPYPHANLIANGNARSDGTEDSMGNRIFLKAMCIFNLSGSGSSGKLIPLIRRADRFLTPL